MYVVSNPLHLAANPNFGAKSTGKQHTKLLQSKVDVSDESCSLSLTFKRELRLFHTVCRLLPSGTATFTDFGEKGAEEVGDGHYSTILKIAGQVVDKGIEAQVACLVECIDRYCTLGEDAIADEAYLNI